MKTVKAGAPDSNSFTPFRLGCDLAEFADRLSTMLTIALDPDPTKPSTAGGTPRPVLDRTGLTGIYEIAVNPRPEPADDSFPLWQRTLKEQLGLKLEAQKARVDTLIISADRVPTQN